MTTQTQLLERIAIALERIAFAMAPESPNYRRPLADMPFGSIGKSATVSTFPAFAAYATPRPGRDGCGR